MGYSLAIGPTLVQFPQSRAVVPQTTRQLPRVEEIVGTARVIRQDEKRPLSLWRTGAGVTIVPANYPDPSPACATCARLECAAAGG